MRERFAGDWEGRWAVRPGREDELTAAERKRFLKTDEVIPLTLYASGAFLHKRSIEGRWNISGEKLNFTPLKLDGCSIGDMRAAAEAENRVFRLDFLFDPFVLVTEGDCLATPNDRKLLYIRFSRVYALP